MNNNNIDFKVGRTREGTVFEIVTAVTIVLSFIFSAYLIKKDPEAGKPMMVMSIIMAFSSALTLLLAYMPNTFNIPDDSPAEAFIATIRLLRIISVMSTALALAITLVVMFGKTPVVPLIVYAVLIVVLMGWYFYIMKKVKSNKKQ